MGFPVSMNSIIFSFDTEEYQSPPTDDATKVWAELLSKHGLRGAFCLVGEKARVLRDRRRTDIIHALQRHEIDYHSDTHSIHPTHAEYLNELNWEEGLKRLLLEEGPGVQDVENIFGQRPFAHCKPGASWGPQVAYGMSLLGMPFFCDAPVEYEPGKPLWYCNQLLLGYHAAFEGFFETEDRLSKLKERFLDLYNSREDGYVVWFTHPCRLFATAFGDGLNFRDGKNTPREQWIPVPIRSRKKIDDIIKDLDKFLEFVAGEGFPVVAYRDVYERYKEENIWVDAPVALTLAAAVRDELTYYPANGMYFSPAEIFGMVAFMLNYFNQDKTLPDTMPVRRPIGPTEKHTISDAPADVPTKSFIDAASEVDRDVSFRHSIPARIKVANANILPGDFLKTGAGLIRKIANGEAYADTITLESGSNEPAIVHRADFKNMRIRGWLFAPDFEATNVVEMAKLQTWTAKPATPIQARRR